MFPEMAAGALGAHEVAQKSNHVSGERAQDEPSTLKAQGGRGPETGEETQGRGVAERPGGCGFLEEPFLKECRQ